MIYIGICRYVQGVSFILYALVSLLLLQIQRKRMEVKVV